MSQNEPKELLDFVANVAGERYLRVEEDLGDGYVRLRVSEAERRQAKHDIRSLEDVTIELLRNSRDAGSCKIFVASHKDAGLRRSLVVIDDGGGIPPKIHNKLFEPRVTAKLDSIVEDSFGIHGRGMALYSIKSVVENAALLYSDVNCGSVVKVVVDTNSLPEKKDQSSFPQVRQLLGQPHAVKGIRNIPRILVEFSLAHPRLEIYFGSHAEILATMRDLSFCTEMPIEDWSQLPGIMDAKNLKIWQLSGFIHESKLLTALCENYYGLDVSERNIYRVLAGEIAPLPPISTRLSQEKSERVSGSIYEEENFSKYLQEEELSALAKKVAESFSEIGYKYFIKLQGEPEIRRERNQLKILLTLVKEEES